MTTQEVDYYLDPNQVVKNTFLLKRNDRDTIRKTGFMINYDQKKYVITSSGLISNPNEASEVVVERMRVPSVSDPVPFEFGGVNLGQHGHDFSAMEVLASPFSGEAGIEAKPADNIISGEDVIYMGFPYKEQKSFFGNGFPMPLIYRGSISSPHLVNGFVEFSVNGGPIISRRHGDIRGCRVLGVVCSKGSRGDRDSDPHGHFEFVAFDDVLKVIDASKV